MKIGFDSLDFFTCFIRHADNSNTHPKRSIINNTLILF